MTPDPLHGARCKVARAREHFRVLQASIESFINDDDAYSVSKEKNAEGGLFIFRLKLHKRPAAIEWSLLIGDCVHNLRSALDHLFWALLLLHHRGGPLPDDSHRATFPITLRPNDFNSRKAGIEKWVGEDAAAMLERLQPYHGQGVRNAALIFLHEADITDKHQLLLPCIAQHDRGHLVYEFRLGAPPPTIQNQIIPAALEDDAVLLTSVIRPFDSVVDVNLKVALNVIFKSEPVQYAVLPSLDKLCEIVSFYLDEFDPLFSAHAAPGS